MEKVKNKKKNKGNRICVDYHFHANLLVSDLRAKKHIIKYWKHIVESGVNVVLSTEHVYKNPKRAYEFMKKYQPKNALVFPGMEYVTSEGVDLVIFSETEKIYEYSELKPMVMTIDEVVDFVLKTDGLYTFVTHPYLKSKTGIVYNLGYEKFQEVLGKVNALEIISGNLFKQKVFKKYWEWFKTKDNFPLKIKTPEKTFYIPRSDYDPKKVDFIAVGSDAHQFGETGNCLELEFDQEFNEKNVFQRIVNSKDGEVKVVPRRHNWLSLLKAPVIIFDEFLSKQKYIKK